LEDKFKASSGWLENFKHRVGIRKGKYIGREQAPEGNASDREMSPSTKLGTGLRTAWTMDPDSPDKWQGDLSHLKEEDNNQSSLMLHSPSTIQQSHILGVAVDPQSPTLQGGSPGHTIPMRKTRSRTLAEARQAHASSFASGSGASSANLTDTTMNVELAQSGSAFGPLSGSNPESPGSPNSHSSASSGREASAGLHAALDFIGSQAQGYATPEEVAVLKNLKQRMSRPDLPSQSSSSSVHSEWVEGAET